MVGDRLALGHQEDGVAVAGLRLQSLDVAVVIGGGEELHRVLPRRRQRVHVQLVDLLAQDHALAGAQRLAPLVGAQVSAGQSGSGRRSPGSRPARCSAGFLRLEPMGEILVLELGEDALPVEEGAGVVPGDGLDRRL